MSFFRNIRSTLSSSSSGRGERGKSRSRDSTPVHNSRPASVISGAASRRDSTTSSTLQRGDTFILNGSDEERQSSPQSNTSTLEKKSKKSKVFSKFSTFTKRKKTPSPEESVSYEHHPSDTATNTYYKWKSEGSDRLIDYDAQADPFNFLYEQQSNRKNGEHQMRRQPSIGSNSSGSFDSSTYRKSKTPTHLREQLEQLKTHSNDDLLEQQEEDERDKYKTVTLSSFRKSFRDRLLQQQKEAPHNPSWFVEVPQPTQPSQAGVQERRESKENRPDYFIFENDNYRPQSRSPLRDRPSRSATRSPVKRNETFRVVQPSTTLLRNASPSPSPTPAPAPSIRIEIKNSIAPHQPGRLVPVGVAKPMPTTEYYAQRLLASTAARQPSPSRSPIATTKWYRTQQPHSPTRFPQQQQQTTQSSTGRYQTLVQIGSGEQSKPSRGRAPTRVQLYGSKPNPTTNQLNTSDQHHQHQKQTTYFGDHLTTGRYTKSSPRIASSNVVVPTIYLGRREPPTPRAAPRRNRSPIKIPWR